MKNLLKKLHMMHTTNSNQTWDVDSSSEKSKERLNDVSSSSSPASGITGWLNSATNRPSPPYSNVKFEDIKSEGRFDSMSSSSTSDATIRVQAAPDSGSINSQVVEEQEEYHLQLALELSAKEDPEAVQIEAVKQISLESCPPQNTPAQVAYRYWNFGALSYDDKVLDGFYDVYDTSTTVLSSKMPSLLDLQATQVSDNITWEAIVVNKAADAKLLQLEKSALDVTIKSTSECFTFVGQDMVQKLAILVSNYMGGPVGDPDKMLLTWQSFIYKLKTTLGSNVLPLGSLNVGMARHRALLFKVLTDSVGIPCRLVKGKQYTGSIDVAMNIIKFSDGREYIVDLMADPGTLIPSDTSSHVDHDESSMSSSPRSRDDNASRVASSRSGLTTSSEECLDFGTHDSTKEKSDQEHKKLLPKITKNRKKREKIIGEIPKRPSFNSHARSPSWTEGVSSPEVRKMKVKDVSQYMIDAAKENPQLAQKLHDVLLESGVVAPANLFTEVYDDQSVNSTLNKEKNTNWDDRSITTDAHPRFVPILPTHKHTSPQSDANPNRTKVPAAAAAAAAAAVVASSMVVAATKTTNDPNIQLPVAAAAAAVVATGLPDVINLLDSPTTKGDEREFDNFQTSENREGDRVSDRSAGNDSIKSEVSLEDVADCEIAWEDITLGERIGLGSYGEVYRGDWHGTEVAVKKFLDQEITVESLEEFKSEVGIMKRVRHPNVVLFMGAVTRAPHLSIVTEFLPRGSLYRLIHRPNNQLDIRRRLRIALDAARGMNYLHNCTPVIVHRDLKSPNLLVDKNWVVKVCDFGLSRMKHSTFLSSRSTAGTAEWMAPEVLRNEPSDEKCDVYSFGVILWELCTLQQPWGGMNPMQVVGAVGFQHRRLEVPDDVDPAIADIITRCWQTDPRLRPTFADIMAALKPLQKPITSSRIARE
ncbi:probable serine/threonine-protein kinase SIS8 isoform X2 [Rutidosis leptorrhynchoides]|uniref:probable serine/threonine-protein kinase SIS8 isoform X2 n=1 Tax=Rutidosis leptorrhynchoides TaxID=125765 RepID=UPI003A9A3AF7